MARFCVQKYALCVYAAGSTRSSPTSDVDLMVVGDVGVKELAFPLRKARERLAREVNVTAYSKEEFVSKAARAGHHFVASVLDKPSSSS